MEGTGCKGNFNMAQLDGLMDCAGGSKHFLNIDLKSDYHQFMITDGEEWKTNFERKECLHEWLVVPFGLTNSPSNFTCLANEELYDFLGNFVVVYLYDILIFSKTKVERMMHL